MPPGLFPSFDPTNWPYHSFLRIDLVVLYVVTVFVLESKVALLRQGILMQLSGTHLETSCC